VTGGTGSMPVSGSPMTAAHPTTPIVMVKL
jgi:hypothetical protein